jgi:hypothetical protein
MGIKTVGHKRQNTKGTPGSLPLFHIHCLSPRWRKDPLPCSFNCREYSNYHCHSFQLFSFFLSLTYLNQGLGLNWIINLRERICSHIDSSSALFISYYYGTTHPPRSNNICERKVFYGHKYFIILFD